MPSYPRSRVLLDVDEYTIGNNYTYSTGSSSNTQSTFYHTIVRNHAIYDIVTPNWKELFAKGVILNNPYSNVEKHTEYTAGTTSTLYTATSGQILTNWPMMERIRQATSYWSPDQTRTYVDTNLAERISNAKLDALSRIDRSPFDFSEDVLELRKTLKTLLNPLGLARDLSNDFNDRFRFYSTGKFNSFTSSLSKAWLEVRFAYRPIMISLENILAESQLNRAVRPSVERHFQHSKFDLEKISIGEDLSYTGGGVAHVNTYHSANGSSTVDAGVIYEVTEPLRNWRWRYGVRDRDLVRAVYNVIPYSWVVDRFLHIDSSIRGLTSLADSKVRILGGWESIKNDYTDNEIILSGTHDTHLSFSPSGSELIRVIEKTRTPWTPQVSDAFPVWHPSHLNTLPQVLDLVTLITSKLRPSYKSGHHLI
jgi:hypothetical protein